MLWSCTVYSIPYQSHIFHCNITGSQRHDLTTSPRAAFFKGPADPTNSRMGFFTIGVPVQARNYSSQGRSCHTIFTYSSINPLVTFSIEEVVKTLTVLFVTTRNPVKSGCGTVDPRSHGRPLIVEILQHTVLLIWRPSKCKCTACTQYTPRYLIVDIGPIAESHCYPPSS